MFLLFDFQYNELNIYKNDIFNIIEEKIILNIKVEYDLVGIIAAPKANHFNCIIFNPLGKNIVLILKVIIYIILMAKKIMVM